VTRAQRIATSLRVDTSEVADLAASLIRIPTVPGLYPGGEAEAVACLAQVLTRERIGYRIDEVSPGRPNIVIELGPETGPALWLNGHLDTVPIGNRLHWIHEPFGGDDHSGQLYGRGASDCKGGVAAMLHAAIAIRRSGLKLPGRVILSAVVGEEEGQVGLRHLLDRGLEADAFVSTQWSTPGRVAVSYRGLCWIEVTTVGRAAHGSRPSEGVNAVEQMVAEVLPALRTVHLSRSANAASSGPGPSVNIASIHGGDVVNVVPDSCRALLDYRITTGQTTGDLLAALETTLDDLRLRNPQLAVTSRVVLTVEPVETDVNCTLLRALTEAVEHVTGTRPRYFGKTGTSDANLVHQRLGIPVVAYGPGNDSGHKPDEHVRISDLGLVAEAYAHLMVGYFG
jgi:succinyl-diaminopimelate desuccinylase